MNFGSPVFLFLFLPAVLALYALCVKTKRIKLQNACLIAANLVFYAFGGLECVPLLLLSVLCNYLAGLFVKGRRWVLACAMAADLGLLCVFKYLGFFIRTLNGAAGTQLSVPSLALPLGISFFTFQGMSYVIDVYRGQRERNKNFFEVLLYITLFPRLVAGPIVRYVDMADELADRTFSLEQLSRGLRRFIIGMSKKLLIADVCGAMVSNIYAFDAPELIDVRLAWLAAVGYLVQIYFDFSGYSDMAIGLGLCFGFHFKENFNYPYISASIKEFWRRWHISLSTWFREYLYIPLGGNRKGTARTYLNKVIVFFCTGLWHGANWTYVLWGMWHGLFIVLEDVVGRRLPAAKTPGGRRVRDVLDHVYTLFVVLVGFVLFRADSLTQGLQLIGALFSSVQTGARTELLLAQSFTPLTAAALLAGIVGSLPLLPAAQKKLSSRGEKAASAAQAAGYAAALALLALDLVRMSAASYVPFIYFQF